MALHITYKRQMKYPTFFHYTEKAGVREKNLLYHIWSRFFAKNHIFSSLRQTFGLNSGCTYNFSHFLPFALFMWSIHGNRQHIRIAYPIYIHLHSTPVWFLAYWLLIVICWYCFLFAVFKWKIETVYRACHFFMVECPVFIIQSPGKLAQIEKFRWWQRNEINDK